MRRQLVALAAVVAALVIATACPATAATSSRTDPRNDVRIYDWGSDSWTTGSHRVDMSGVTLRHTSLKAIVTVGFFHSRSAGRGTFRIHIDTDSDAAAEYVYAQDAYRGLYKVASDGLRKWPCDITTTGYFSEPPFKVAIPRRCLGSPARVRVRAVRTEMFGPGLNDRAQDATAWTARVGAG